MKNFLCALFAFSVLALSLPADVCADEVTDKLAAEFVAKLQKLIKENNVKAIAKEISYPLNVYDEGIYVAQNEAEFIKNYDKIFTPYVKNCILNEAEDGPPFPVRGIYYVGGATCIWVAEENPGQMQLISIRYRTKPKDD